MEKRRRPDGAAGAVPARRRRASPATAAAAPIVAGVRIGNASKLLYPESGLTKLELARYYESVAPLLLEHAGNRPLTLLRCPNGIASACFFQKNAAGADPSLGRVRIPDGDGTRRDSIYLYVHDATGLVALLQMGVLELHVWGATVRDIERPDRLVFDLDPGPGVSWQAVIDAARLLRSTLQQLGLESRVMTTGGKGLHVVLPVEPELEWSEAKSFTRALVAAVMRLEPGRYTASLPLRHREQRIFIDWLRNGRGATAVAPYSTRARPDAPVAVPIAWEELEPSLRPDRWNLRNLADRLKRMAKDPWQQQPIAGQSLRAIVDAAKRGDASKPVASAARRRRR